MENKKVALLLNGDYKDESFYENALEDYDFIVCADGAGNIMHRLKLIPDILLGDLDSISQEALDYFEGENVAIERFNPEKDFSDSQLALIRIKELGYKSVDIYGGFGNRVDHTLGNIGLIYWGDKQGLSVKFIDENNVLYPLKTGVTLVPYNKNSIFSILACFEDLEGLSIENAKYTLDKFFIGRGVPIGISNEVLGKAAKITLKNGFGLLCIANKI